MQQMIDIGRWQQIRDAEADARAGGPQFHEIQRANAAAASARDAVARWKAAGPTGRPTPPPFAPSRRGEEVLPGIGGSTREAIARAHTTTLRELEDRVVEAEGTAKRLSERMRIAGERRANLAALVEAIQQWAAAEGVVLPGTGSRVETSVHVPNAPANARTFLGIPI